MATHGECANYRDGKCMLFGVTVDPNAPACPRFTPRTAAPSEYAPPAPSAPAGGWGYPPVPPAGPGEGLGSVFSRGLSRGGRGGWVAVMGRGFGGMRRCRRGWGGGRGGRGGGRNGGRGKGRGGGWGRRGSW